MSNVNYLSYRKQPGDRRYRIVHLTGTGAGEFREFESNVIRYAAQQDVLEILDENRETRIVYDAERDLVTMSRLSQNELNIPAHVPLQRLWVKPKNGKGICYKVIGVLNKEKTYNRIWIPAGISKVELVGDRYFSAAFILK